VRDMGRYLDLLWQAPNANASARGCDQSDISDQRSRAGKLRSHLSLLSHPVEPDADPARAEARAWRDAAAIWYRRHGKHVRGDLCAGCGRPLDGTAGVILLPFGERAHAVNGYTCVHAYGLRWKRQAATALAAAGIATPREIEVEIADGGRVSARRFSP
jgi:hypothetical protein